MNQPLDELYFPWLYRQVASTRLKNPQKTHWSLLRQLYTKEFVWFVPNDDNRMEDGRDLRHEFTQDEYVDEVDPVWLDMGCSFLEMLIALSRRLAFETESQASWWFWKLLENLRVSDFNDKVYGEAPRASETIDGVLDNVIWRTYNHDGTGGLFPLEHPSQDQRDVEIWYQLNAYLLENE